MTKRLTDAELDEMERRCRGRLHLSHEAVRALVSEVREGRSILSGKTFYDRPELVQERDAALIKLKVCEEINETLEMLAGDANVLSVERDAARAEVRRLREALEYSVAVLDEVALQPESLGVRIDCDVLSALRKARAALASAPDE